MSMYLQDRDLHIFREVADCRFLTLSQIAKLCFGDRPEAAKKRLQKLQRAGFIVRHSPGILSTSLYLLTRAGGSVIKTRDQDSTRSSPCTPPSIVTIKHEVALRDFRASVFQTCAQERISVEEFSIDSNALSFVLPEGLTRPDGYFAIRSSNTTFRFFVEVDNGTEPYRTLVKKVEAYRVFYKAGTFAKRCRGACEDYRVYPFRIIFLFANEKRMISFVSHLKTHGISNFVLATTEYALKRILYSHLDTCTKS